MEDEIDPTLTARDVAGDPLESIPEELHDLMPPFLTLASKFGREIAERATLSVPLPWRQDQVEAVFDAMVGGFDQIIRAELETMPEVVFGAMHRQLFITFCERMEEMAIATNAAPSTHLQ